MRAMSTIGFLRDFKRDRKGLAAMEFALIAPLMIGLYFGVTEISNALLADSKVATLASSAADLIAQDTSVTNAEMNDTMAALNTIMFPFPTDDTKIVISSLTYSSPGQARVAWSDARGGSPRNYNSTVNVPTGLIAVGGSVIFAEVEYRYESPVGKLLVGPVTLTDSFYMRPRRVDVIPRTN